jgi:hypothetical protein
MFDFTFSLCRYASGDEEEEDEDDDGDVNDDVPDRDYVKNSSQQMSDKAGRCTS